jgi:anti-sigma factor ChrR (cupin superfamily)
MGNCEYGDRASLYALGLLDSDELLVFERHMSTCPSCATAVRESSEMTDELSRSLPVSTPPARLRERVLSETQLPQGVLALVRGKRIQWLETPFQGVSMARLFEDCARGELVSLVRMLPGARYPSHRHGGLEHCFVIEGDLVFEDHTLLAGDYAAGGPDQDHSSATTSNGCFLFIIHNSADQVHVK